MSPLSIKNCSDISVLQMQKGRAIKRHGNSFLTQRMRRQMWLEFNGFTFTVFVSVCLTAMISFNAAGESSPPQPRSKSTQLQGLPLRMGGCVCVLRYSIHTVTLGEAEFIEHFHPAPQGAFLSWSHLFSKEDNIFPCLETYTH